MTKQQQMDLALGIIRELLPRTMTKQQQMDLALGIIRELLQFVPQIPSDAERQLLRKGPYEPEYNARRRAENFLKAMEECQ